MSDWDSKVRPHLNLIAAGAEIASRNAKQLPRRVEWRTLAQDELEEARKVLETALAQIIAAEVTYETKPLESARAA